MACKKEDKKYTKKNYYSNYNMEKLFLCIQRTNDGLTETLRNQVEQGFN